MGALHPTDTRASLASSMICCDTPLGFVAVFVLVLVLAVPLGSSSISVAKKGVLLSFSEWRVVRMDDDTRRRRVGLLGLGEKAVEVASADKRIVDLYRSMVVCVLLLLKLDCGREQVATLSYCTYS